MSSLNFYKSGHVDQLVRPAKKNDISLNSPATDIFTNFAQHEPLVIESDTDATELEHLMRKAHVRLKIVINKQGNFLGIVTLEQLTGPNRVKKIAEGNKMEDLVATDFMLPKAELSAFEYSELVQAKINDVVEALKTMGVQHTLVIDGSSLRGVISATDIARKLKIDIDLSKSNSFAELYEAIF